MKLIAVGAVLFDLAVLVCLIPCQGLAIVGNPAQSVNFNYPATCRLIIRDYSGAPFNCTGFLVRPDILISAGHCTKSLPREEIRNHKIWAECGYEGTVSSEFRFETTPFGNSLLTGGPHFQEKILVVDQFQNPHGDQVAYRLERPSSIEPYQILNIVNQPYDACVMVGYGINNKGYGGDLSNGFFVGGKTKLVPNDLKQKVLHITSNLSSNNSEDFDFVQNNMVTYTRELIQRAKMSSLDTPAAVLGDSGGPLICRLKNGQAGVVANMFYVEFSRDSNVGNNTLQIQTRFQVLTNEFVAEAQKSFAEAGKHEN
jgi:hypothetical protein